MAVADSNPAPSMLEYAIGYAMRGLPVFPICTPLSEKRCLQHGTCMDGGKSRAGKVPLVPWKDYQSRVPTMDEVGDWWGTRWPTANIGMATGALSGIVALDADGTEARKEAMRRGLPKTPAVWTGKPGGAHIHFKHPGEPVRNFARKIPGTDFRGDGGYVLLPPSLHELGSRYRWVEGTENFKLASMPRWLSDLLKGIDEETGEQQPHETLDVDAVLRGVGEGERDTTLWRFACKLREDNVQLAYAEALVCQAARACRPAFDQALALEKVRRAYREYQPSTRLEPPPRDDDAPVEATQPEAYPLQSLAQVAEYVEEVTEQLVRGMLWRNRVTWAFSEPNTGKTLLLLAAAMHIAAGKPFCGREVMQGPVLLIEEDSPFSVLGEYAAMLADIYEIDLAAIPFWVNKLQGLRITDSAGYRLAKQAVDLCPQAPIYVLLDAAERLVPSDRYTTKELDWLTRYLQWLLGRHITPTVIDHTRKPPQVQPQAGRSAPIKRRPLDDLFGARAKSAISDVMLFFSGSLKTGGVRLSFEKFRGETPESFDVSFSADDGFTISDQPPIAQTPNEHKVLAWFNHEGGSGFYSTQEIASAAGVNYRTAQRAVAALTTRRCLVKVGLTSDAKFGINPDLPGVFS